MCSQEDVSKVPELSAELLKRGLSEEELGKFLGLNAIRVLEEAEKVAARLQQERPASESARKDLDGPEAAWVEGSSKKRKRTARAAPSVFAQASGGATNKSVL
jgi:hypothetical protein